MTTRKTPASRTPAAVYATSRDAAVLPIVMELALLLESVAVLLPDGAARLPEVAAQIFSKPAILSQGTEARSTGEIIDALFRQYPILLRSWAPDVPECTTFVVDEDGVAVWLRMCAGRDGGRDEQFGRDLAVRVDELQAALTRRVRIWAGSERVPETERTCADMLPNELGSFLFRRARQVSVTATADERGHVTLRLQG